MWWLLRRLGGRLARFLSKPRPGFAFAPTCAPELLARTLRKGDVLLIEGTSRFSMAIKYITQSNWSHAALVVAEADDQNQAPLQSCRLIEADVNVGVRTLPLAEYAHGHTRICRPVGLTEADIDHVIDYAETRLGHQYDLKNVVDLARYLIQTPPVPIRWRRRLLALGSGDPTKAICSSLIAQAFQSVRYPILPEISREASADPQCRDCYDELLHIRHYSLFAPRDFDISPYFRIVKPTLEDDFDPYSLSWDLAGPDPGDEPVAAGAAPGPPRSSGL
ncbi:hypothetical protein PC39_14432 [Salinisphaera sp. PC39]|uniref:YiiX/YebB-like N1pC/P60 family cysteine hydrolase n=1 Tax=Salinisphaera sp. PC39 TaxID=1304156 RepID=UPI003341121E